MAVDLLSYAKMTGTSTVHSNLAVFNGGGIWVDGRLDIVSDNADVFLNTATDGGGGGIWVESGYLRLFQGDVWSNQCGTSAAVTNMPGGGIGAVDSFVEMGDSAYVYDNAGGSGGGLALINSTAYVGRAKTADAYFGYNDVTHTGGGMYASNSVVHFRGASFWSNTAAQAGGGAGFYLSQADSDTNGLYVSFCRAGGDGGGFYLKQSDVSLSQVFFGESEGRGNEAQGNGGGICAESSKLGVVGGLFRDNRSPNTAGHPNGYGGGIALFFSSLVVTNPLTGDFTNTVFIGNAASTNFGAGGAVYVGDQCTSVVYGATMTSNFATEGGAVYAGRYARNEIWHSSLSGNTTSRDGGAINSYMATTLVVRSSLERNTADSYGGAIKASFGGLNVEGSRFLGNTSGNDGGAILLMSGVRFTGLCELLPLYTATNGFPLLFQENVSSNGGGAIRSYSSSVILQYASFISNRASGVGTAAAFDNGTVFRVQDSLFVQNTGSTFGSLYADASTGAVCGVTMVRTDAEVLGLYDSAVGVTNSILRGYFTPIYAPGSSVTVVHCNVENGYAGTGNIDADPMLYDNWHLKAGSPCINQGTPVSGLSFDIDAEQRTGNNDMGFDEFMDSDGDRLPDAVETATGIWLSDINTGTKPGDPESDGDNMPDGDEIIANTNPTDPASYLGFDEMRWEGGMVIAGWRCGQAANLALDVCTNLSAGCWDNVQYYPAPTPTSITENVIAATGTVFRVRAWR